MKLKLIAISSIVIVGSIFGLKGTNVVLSKKLNAPIVPLEQSSFDKFFGVTSNTSFNLKGIGNNEGFWLDPNNENSFEFLPTMEPFKNWLYWSIEKPTTPGFTFEGSFENEISNDKNNSANGKWIYSLLKNSKGQYLNLQGIYNNNTGDISPENYQENWVWNSNKNANWVQQPTIENPDAGILNIPLLLINMNNVGQLNLYTQFSDKYDVLPYIKQPSTSSKFLIKDGKQVLTPGEGVIERNILSTDVAFLPIDVPPANIATLNVVWQEGKIVIPEYIKDPVVEGNSISDIKITFSLDDADLEIPPVDGMKVIIGNTEVTPIEVPIQKNKVIKSYEAILDLTSDTSITNGVYQVELQLTQDSQPFTLNNININGENVDVIGDITISSSALSAGLIAGIVLVSIAGIGLIVMLFIQYSNKKKIKKELI